MDIERKSSPAGGARQRAGRLSGPVKADNLDLAADVGLHDALRRIIEACLDHLVANRAATMAGHPEGLHQMRVAMRRLRSALVLFKRHLEPYAAAHFAGECRRLGQVLGEARDWSVFTQDTLPEAKGEGVDIAQLETLAEAELARSWIVVRKTIAERAFAGFVAATRAWVAGEAWAAAGRDNPKAMNRPLADLAPAMLDRLADKVHARGGHFRRRPPEELHELRKSLKKLRYGVDFLGRLYSRKDVRRYLQACEELQTLLGTMNDMATTMEFAQRLNGGLVELLPDMGALARWSETRSYACHEHLDAAWPAFARAEPFWRKP